MIKFESDNIIVGFIKNLLTEFKLPTPKVYNYDTNDYAVDGQLYIKDDYVCQYNKTKDEFIQLFRFDLDSIPQNYYKTLKFTGVNYDTHTHEYLGNYLRFIRDYKGLNLMPLYNCFSNSFPKQVALKLDIDEETEEQSISSDTTYELYINPEDEKYKVLMLPVKMNQSYTIAIDCKMPYEIFCGFYGKAFNTTTTEFWTKTLLKVPSSSFSTPFIYDKLNLENFKNLALRQYRLGVMKEDDLKLFIKLPSTNKSSIVVLEGNYLNNNDWNLNLPLGNSFDIFKPQYNYSILNFEPDFEDCDGIINPIPDVKYDNLIISNLQLLKLNSEVNYPFADRLIEYLVQNVISPLDDISDNIKRLQWILYDRYLEGKTTTGIDRIGKTYGIWNDKYVAILYKVAIEEGLINSKSDILGYVDKDIEGKIGKYVDLNEREGN